MNNAVTLDRIDLETLRCLETVSNRLVTELKAAGSLQLRMDLLVSFLDGQKVGRTAEAPVEEERTPEDVMAAYQLELEATLKQMTIGVWNAGQKLRRLREETQTLEQTLEQTEEPEE